MTRCHGLSSWGLRAAFGSKLGSSNEIWMKDEETEDGAERIWGGGEFLKEFTLKFVFFIVVVKARLAAAESGPRQDWGNCDLRT